MESGKWWNAKNGNAGKILIVRERTSCFVCAIFLLLLFAIVGIHRIRVTAMAKATTQIWL